MAKRKRKSNNKNQQIVNLLVIAAIVVILFYIFTYNDSFVGDLPPGEVDDDGLCTGGREGIDLGVCCSQWDNDIGDIVWVPCDDFTKEDPTANLQAFFRFEQQPNFLIQQPSIMYYMVLTNEGDVEAEFRIASVTTVSDSGDMASELEFSNAFRSLAPADQWFVVPKGGSKVFSMSAFNPIRLDLPLGSSTYGLTPFVVVDGNYSTTITIESREAAFPSQVTTQERTIVQEVWQEVVSFNIDIPDPTQ